MAAVEVPASVDVLMISHNRADYYRRSLRALLDSHDAGVRIWLWHNGSDASTEAVFEEFRTDPRVHRSHKEPINRGLRAATNWVWLNGTAEFVSKVDDDCLEDSSWLVRLRSAHAGTDLGAVAAWRFYPEDFLGPRAVARFARLPSGDRLMRSNWVQGSGYLLPRKWIDRCGPIAMDESFPDWCIRAARDGARHGWLFPFIFEDHMDDPRSTRTLFTSQAAFDEHRPLHAQLRGITSLHEWRVEQTREAGVVQRAVLDWLDYHSPRARMINGVAHRLKRIWGRAKGMLQR